MRRSPISGLMPGHSSWETLPQYTIQRGSGMPITSWIMLPNTFLSGAAFIFNFKHCISRCAPSQCQGAAPVPLKRTQTSAAARFNSAVLTGFDGGARGRHGCGRLLNNAHHKTGFVKICRVVASAQAAKQDEASS